MTLYEQVKAALRSGATPKEVAAVFGISERIAEKIKELLLTSGAGS
jgi:hypothetical protein